MRLWRTADGREQRQFIGHKRPVWAVALVPGGKLGISAGYDEVAKIWDLETGREIEAPP
jgi:WD40 repeat protein